ncbi:MAG: SDR family oxidoreductase, partial [Arenimonas sp.]
GRAVAIHFAREGADVAILYLNEDADAMETSGLIEAEGRRCLRIKGDAKSLPRCRSAIERTVRTLGRLDILVNNLGDHVPQNKLEDITARQLRQTFENNVYPFFNLTRFALAHMKRGSCIINTGSVTSFRGSDHLIDYAATKGAIESFTYSLAKSLVERGIRVNGVAPGPIWTPLIASRMSKKEQREFGKNTPMKRAGQPSEVAPAFVYLACKDSSYVTGQFIHVNGGGFIG